MSNFRGRFCSGHVDIDLTPEVTIFIVASVDVQYSVTTARGLTLTWLQFNTTADVTFFFFFFFKKLLVNSWTKLTQSTDDPATLSLQDEFLITGPLETPESLTLLILFVSIILFFF